jgi:hypothetical protein
MRAVLEKKGFVEERFHAYPPLHDIAVFPYGIQVRKP